MRELTKPARISSGNGPVTALPPHWVSLDDFIVTHEGREYAWRQFLEDTLSDALVVLHEGDGQTLCRFGRSTGATCSEVNDLSVCSTVNEVEFCRLVRMNDDEALNVSVRSN